MIHFDLPQTSAGLRPALLFYRHLVPGYFLNTYRPLQLTADGRAAASRYGIAPYVDASCRRESDFEARWPTITALCRRTKFAPRLQVGDHVAHMTVKFGGHWRLVALLTVEQRFERHESAADWYRSRRTNLPSNLMVAGNPPRPLDETYRCSPCSDRLSELRQWDAHYRERSEECGVVLVCRIDFLNLNDPPLIAPDDWRDWIGKRPHTRAGLKIDEPLWRHLERRAHEA